MPGPGAHTVQAFVGPDIGVFGEWIFKELLHHYPQWLENIFMNWIHDPWGYMCFSLGLALIYMHISKRLLTWRWLRVYSQGPLSYIQCYLLGSAGGISHFFMDSLFERNSQKLEAVMATGDANKQVYPFPVLIVAIILTILFAVFVYIYRSEPARPLPPSRRELPPRTRSLFAPLQSLLVSGTRWMAPPRSCVPHTKFGCICGCLKSWFPELWCLKSYVRSSIRQASFQMSLDLCGVAALYVKFLDLYKTKTHLSGIGEEADVGVVIFMATYFIAPHLMCILAMHQKQ